MEMVAVLGLLKAKFQLEREASRVLVVGLGKTGFSVAQFLQRYDFNFSIVDSRISPPLEETVKVRIPGIRVFTGGFEEGAFNAATHLIVSPGVSLNESVIEDARNKGVKILSDIDLFSCSIEEPVIAITGSNGKSTVTTMLGKMAEADGKEVGVGGNLGTPALDLLQEKAELYILELSSFQLERTSVLEATAATVLNVTLDHMDRHGDLDRYAEEKNRVFKGNGVMVLNVDDPIVCAMRKTERKTLTFGLNSPADFQVKYIGDLEWMVHGDVELMPVQDLPLEGRHNLSNALAALALGEAIGLSAKAMCQALREFNGLEHRMQRIAVINGVVWINDSKATNIGACIAALQGCEHKVILIAGGDAKGSDMHDLVPVVKGKVKAVVLMGKDADLIERALNGCVPVCLADTVQQAVKIAAGLAKEGESVLLSPACASIDQFENYQERGNKFIAAVRSLAA